MRTRLLTTTMAVLLLATVVAAQQVQISAQKPAEGSAAAPQSPPKAPAQLVNVRLELTITDQRGEAPAAPKTVTLLVADRESGRIRTGRNNAMLNVDVRPEVVRDGRIRTTLSLEYTPLPVETDRVQPMAITESLTALLDDGKPQVVSQSADPGSDRKVKVELKATIVK